MKVEITGNWLDVVASESLTSTDIAVQNVSDDVIEVVFNGTEPAAGASGWALERFDSVSESAVTACWIRSLTGAAQVSVIER